MLPLAAQLRPQNLDEYIGQTHLVGEGKPIRKMIEQKQVPSMIFWGPPGVGKTTLARIIANSTNRAYFELSAVSAKKEDIKKIVDQVRNDRARDKDTFLELLELEPRTRNLEPVLFLDEIHRFNKAQQDFLLPYVEDGTITLIGATTENPSFEVIAPLLSRSRVFVLKELNDVEMAEVIERAVSLIERVGTHRNVSEENDVETFEKTSETVSIADDAKDWLIKMANGDARQALTMIDNTWQLYQELTIESFKNTLQSKHLRYDKKGEEHYNTISAFIKSMRASNVDAALYYLARMVDSGEDPKFIARRMVIFASEDIGLAQPTALVVANAVFDAVSKIGYPEAQINLAHGVAYLAECKKDRSAYDAYFSALADVQKFGNLPIPLNLRNAPTKLMKELHYGKGYEAYTKESLLPDELKGKKYLKTEE